MSLRAWRFMTTFGLLVFSPAGAAFAQQLGGDKTPDVSLVRVFLALLVCLIVAVFAALLLRQKFRGGSLPLFTKLAARSNRLHLIESRRIAPQSDLCLVRCDNEEYLLLIAPASVAVLNHYPVKAANVGVE